MFSFFINKSWGMELLQILNIVPQFHQIFKHGVVHFSLVCVILCLNSTIPCFYFQNYIIEYIRLLDKEN